MTTTEILLIILEIAIIAELLWYQLPMKWSLEPCFIKFASNGITATLPSMSVFAITREILDVDWLWSNVAMVVAINGKFYETEHRILWCNNVKFIHTRILWILLWILILLEHMCVNVFGLWNKTKKKKKMWWLITNK